MHFGSALRFTRLSLFTLIIGAWLCLLPMTSLPARADPLVFGTDWRAQAEHGGFYQALAQGYYAAAGLDVTIRQGGPQVNHAQLLAAGKIDIGLAPNSFIALNYVVAGVPVRAVAAFFQKDPAILMARPEVGAKSLADLKGRKIMIGSDTRIGSWRFLTQKFGFTDSQIAPYAFSLAPFLANPAAIQQGYAGSEPYLVAQAGIDADVFLLADEGYASYGALIMMPDAMIKTAPQTVQAFVDASRRGWQDYLYGDPAPGDALIRRDNPDMSPDLLAYGREQMRTRGIVDGGDAQTNGIGTMDPDRWQAFADTMTDAGVYAPGLDAHKAYTTRFVTPSGPTPADHDGD